MIRWVCDGAGPKPEIYQVHVWIRQISPMIWRRLLVHSDSTLADLHYVIENHLRLD